MKILTTIGHTSFILILGGCMEEKQRFVLRKYKLGLASVLICSFFLIFPGKVDADEQGILKSTSIETSTETNALDYNYVASTDSHDISKNIPFDETRSGIDTSPPQALGDSINSENTTEDQKKSTTSEMVTYVEAKSDALASLEDKIDLEYKTDVRAEMQPQLQGSQSADNSNHKSEVVQPYSISSNEMITIPQTWDHGYKGEGMVIAVIDSGLDVDHEVIRLTDLSKAKYKKPEELETAKLAAGIDYGKWYNNKVVFAYDYFDGSDTIKENGTSSHGMVVTGIAAGNPEKESPNGEKVYGVAPEAQVMLMRVFSNRNSYTDSSLYVKAINDAVALGADVINLSLGSEAGSVVNSKSDISEAISRAREKGVSVVIAAGNSSTFGYGYSTPYAENPDYGLVANPSTVEKSISVASINNKLLTTDVFQVRGLEDNVESNHGHFNFVASKSEVVFEQGKEYDYIVAGLGKEEDFAGLELTGKVALIRRGEIPFTEKISNAFKHGAAGALIYNNVDETNFPIEVFGDAAKIPSAFISKYEGELLQSGHYKIVFDGSMENVSYENAQDMSAFSNWGVSVDGILKPDVTAPGGNIYASNNDNSYSNMSGTSMASPHLAGVAALVTEYLNKRHPELEPTRISKVVKALIMSSAKPHKNRETGAYTSPRQQGAGVVDTAAAVSTDLYVTGDGEYPSVSLGNVEDSFSFNVTLHNISDQDRTLKMIVNTDTDMVKNGFFTLTPRQLMQTVWPEVTVKAHSDQTVTVKIDVSQFSKELLKEMPNGYFIEGFVRFVNPTDDGDIVSLPFTGFRGQFQDLPAFEKPIYQLIVEGKDGFYYQVPEDKSIDVFGNATELLTEYRDYLYSQADTKEEHAIVLGTVANEKGKQILNFDSEGKVRLAISPNGDGVKDDVTYRSVALRNAINVKAAVYSSSDSEHTNPIWESNTTDITKNYFGKNLNNPLSNIFVNTTWKGIDKKGQAVADGLYDYVISYTPDVPGAKEQKQVFTIQVDRQKPSITSGYLRLREGKEEFVPRQLLDTGQGGIVLQEVVYLTAFDDGEYVKEMTDENGQKILTENIHRIPPSDDGSYLLPENVKKSDIYYQVEDFAGNRDVISLADLIRDQNSGRFEVKIVDPDSQEELKSTFVYRIKDQYGEYVTLDKSKKVNFLPFGHYTAELFTYNKNTIDLISQTQQEFDINENNSFKDIVFYGKAISYAPVSINFDQTIPRNSSIILKNKKGDSFVLPYELYGKNGFGKNVPIGTYQIFATLPTGYELVEDKQSIEVMPGHTNSFTLNVVSKLALLQAINQHTEVVKMAQYYNAKEDKRNSYDQAYTKAKIALTQKLSQSQVDELLASLELARTQLDGQLSDLSALKTAMETYTHVSQSGRYINAKYSYKHAYDEAYRAVTLLAISENVRQEQIDQVLSAFEDSEAYLNGKDTDFSNLLKLVNREKTYQLKNYKYIYASVKLKEVYLNALDHAQSILNTAGASQDEVNTVIKEIKKAKKNLDGKKPKAHKGN